MNPEEKSKNRKMNSMFLSAVAVRYDQNYYTNTSHKTSKQYTAEVTYLGGEMEAEMLVMRSESVNGVESGGSGADPLAVGVGHG